MLAEAVVDENGSLVTGKVAVLKVWKKFVEKLSKADVIPTSDHAEADCEEYDDEFFLISH